MVLLWLHLHSGLIERAVLRGEQLRGIVDHVVVEHVGCPLHSLIDWLLTHDSLAESLLRVQVAALDQQLLQLEEVILDVLVLHKEGVLVGGLTHQEELLTESING